MATQHKKAVSLAAIHKATLDDLNATLGQSVVMSWEKMHYDYYDGIAQYFCQT